MIKGMDSCLFSYIGNFKVVDKNNVNVGRIGDALLSKNDLDIDSVLIHGSFVEEKLEDIGVREDIDPIVPVNLISKVDTDKSTITLSEAKENLKTTSKDWSPPDNVYQLSKLRKTPVMDSEGEKVGTIIDVYWESNKNHVLVLGGGWLEEFFESIRMIADKDLLVPSKIISSFSADEIKLTVTRKILKTTLQESLTPESAVTGQKPGFVHRGSMSTLMVHR
ncbi:MAG: PRC-barrel domain-containing protein [Candidatus Hodarchaeales archaeon]|jgi:sporulation protein YlmC with PRC-barrel domain